ncbi:hypothetical protein Krac_4621 [Ktedonobacter racemifer DSM 44963]|uniref:Uncharacterized protein n=1 Tax=Ktedonobacter racemifer DSM 44963 TaxID=485913 RepID=D6TT78_KTERA|nr:hypothetical protein Krac_4621 [Ktedonobacter racemifer DSM 44963]
MCALVIYRDNSLDMLCLQFVDAGLNMFGNMLVCKRQFFDS